MAISYLVSNKVKMFPSAFRGDGVNPVGDKESFLTSEGNFVGISSKVTNEHLNYVFEGESGEICIVIHGYLFNVSKTDLSHPCFAGIKIENAQTNILPTLINAEDPANHKFSLDATGNFGGLAFAGSSTELTDAGFDAKYIIQVLDADNNIPTASKLLISSTQVSNGLSSKDISDTFTTATANITTANITTITTANVSGNASIAGTLDAGNTSIAGTLSTTGNASIGGTLTVDSTSALKDSVEIGVGTNNTKSLTVHGPLYIKNQTTTKASIDKDGTVIVEGTLNAHSGVFLNGSVDTANKLTFAKNTGREVYLQATYPTSNFSGYTITLPGATGTVALNNIDNNFSNAQTFTKGLTISSGYTATLNGLTASKAVVTDANKGLATEDLTVSNSGTSDGVTFVKTLSQSATGKISYTTGIVRKATASQSGIVTADSDTQEFAGPKQFNGTVSFSGYATIKNRLSFNNNGETGYITKGADAYLTSYHIASDRRIKENIKPFESKGSILDLPVVEFDYTSSGRHTIGCIAQDLQEICPEIVNENCNGYLTIEENKIVYLLLNEVKKLRKELDELKGE